MTTSGPEVTMKHSPVQRSLALARWFWLDWLRVLAMGTIFLFHSSRPFAPPSWHVMNSSMDLWFTLFDAFISGWIMPLFCPCGPQYDNPGIFNAQVAGLLRVAPVPPCGASASRGP